MWLQLTDASGRTIGVNSDKVFSVGPSPYRYAGARLALPAFHKQRLRLLLGHTGYTDVKESVEAILRDLREGERAGEAEIP